MLAEMFAVCKTTACGTAENVPYFTREASAVCMDSIMTVAEFDQLSSWQHYSSAFVKVMVEIYDPLFPFYEPKGP